MSGRVAGAMPSGSDAFSPEEFAAAAGVSRETLGRFKKYCALLEDWNTRHNLISRASMADIWRRHFWDSAQVAPLLSTTAKTLVDLGSGAGFPGLVLAELRPDLQVTLIEATAKKVRFLTAAADELGLRPEIRHERIEDAPGKAYDVITARACAPLPDLLAYTQRFWGPRSRAFLHKGQNLALELTQARKSWRIESEQHASRSDPSGIILEIRELQRVGRQPNHR
jgi:16S rRNA (guanine527-N7)-methyltransferase